MTPETAPAFATMSAARSAARRGRQMEDEMPPTTRDLVGPADLTIVLIALVVLLLVGNIPAK